MKLSLLLLALPLYAADTAVVEGAAVNQVTRTGVPGVVVQSIQLDRVECGPVEIHSHPSVVYREPGGDAGSERLSAGPRHVCTFPLVMLAGAAPPKS